jgi:hypothetical protein
MIHDRKDWSHRAEAAILSQKNNKSRHPHMRKMIRTTAAILCVAMPCAALADEFSFKRVKVGDSQPGKRITVQIDPEEQARFLASLPKVDPNGVDVPEPKPAAEKNNRDGTASPGPGPHSSYAWFWDEVPPGIADVSGRFDLALAALSRVPTARWSARPGCSTCRRSPMNMAPRS